MLRAAALLLFYPLLYIALTMTLSVTRLANFVGCDWGDAVVFVGATLFTCGGWCNVVLYTATRRGIVGWEWFGWVRWIGRRCHRRGTRDAGAGVEGMGGGRSGVADGVGVKEGATAVGLGRDTAELDHSIPELDVVQGRGK